jgi:hypothetical protein
MGIKGDFQSSRLKARKCFTQKKHPCFYDGSMQSGILSGPVGGLFARRLGPQRLDE